MTQLKMPKGDDIYVTLDHVVVFNQLAVKIEMDHASNDDYFRWLDETSEKRRCPTRFARDLPQR